MGSGKVASLERGKTVTLVPKTRSCYLFLLIRFLGNKRDQVGNGTKHDLGDG